MSKKPKLTNTHCFFCNYNFYTYEFQVKMNYKDKSKGHEIACPNCYRNWKEHDDKKNSG